MPVVAPRGGRCPPRCSSPSAWWCPPARRPPPPCRSPASTLTFTTSDGLDHETYPYLGSNGHLRIDDPGGIALGASGCTSVSAGVVDCGAPSAFTRLVLSFGAGNDTMAVGDGLHWR